VGQIEKHHHNSVTKAYCQLRKIFKRSNACDLIVANTVKDIFREESEEEKEKEKDTGTASFDLP